MFDATPLLEKLIKQSALSQTEAYTLFNSIMHGEPVSYTHLTCRRAI